MEICQAGLADLLGYKPEDQHEPKKTIVLKIPMQLRRRGVEAKLIIGNQPGEVAEPDPALIKLIADANAYLGQLTGGSCSNLAELSRKTGKSSTEISRVLPLAFLAPDITRAIISGQQPAELTTQILKRTKPLPANWSKQRQILDFTAAE